MPRPFSCEAKERGRPCRSKLIRYRMAHTAAAWPLSTNVFSVLLTGENNETMAPLARAGAGAGAGENPDYLEPVVMEEREPGSRRFDDDEFGSGDESGSDDGESDDGTGESDDGTDESDGDNGESNDGDSESDAAEESDLLQMQAPAHSCREYALLHRAAMQDDAGRVRELIGGGVPADVADAEGRTPLQRALEKGASNPAFALIGAFLQARKGAVLEVPLREPTPLEYAIRFNALKVASLLIGAGVGVSATNAYYSTPLHVAAMLDRAEIARMLLEAGADIEARNDEGDTPLQCAVAASAAATLRVLLVRSTARGVTQAPAPRYAATRQFRALQERILARHNPGSVRAHRVGRRLWRADVEARDRMGCTPLIVAVNHARKIKIIRMLLEAGADLEAVDLAGCTALHYAVESDNKKIVSLLLAAGSKPGRKTLGAEPRCTMRLAARGVAWRPAPPANCCTTGRTLREAKPRARVCWKARAEFCCSFDTLAAQEAAGRKGAEAKLTQSSAAESSSMPGTKKEQRPCTARRTTRTAG